MATPLIYLFIFFFINLNLQIISADEPTIIIIGGGPAGVAAASKLLENGISDITILEAENRIGGRVYTTKFDDYLVDLGGQWVHGEKGNVAYDLAWPMGLLEHSNLNRYGLQLFLTNGTRLFSQEQMNNITGFYFKIQDSYDEYEEEGKIQSVGEIFRKAFENYIEIRPDLSAYKNELLNLFELIENSEDSAMSWDDTYSNSECGAEGDKSINWKKRGYSTILDILMRKYPDPTKELPVLEKTKLNTEVTKIDYLDAEGKVKVHTKNGNLYEADHVIVTPSLGVLKATHETLFEPQLSDEKKNFINNYGFGSVAKIYLLFDSPWWIKEDDKSYGLSLLWTDKDKSIKTGDKAWQLSIMGMFRVEHKPNILCVWMSGKGSIEMEKIPEDTLKQQINEILDIFKKEYNVTYPTQLLRTQWYSNEHFRGTYSYYSMDAVRNNASQTTFAEPILKNKPKILFAGEATDVKYSSTVHGAISSGWREADKILKYHKITGE